MAGVTCFTQLCLHMPQPFGSNNVLWICASLFDEWPEDAFSIVTCFCALQGELDI